MEKTPEDFYFEVRFMGLDVALTHQLQGVAEATVQGEYWARQQAWYEYKKLDKGINVVRIVWWWH